MNDQEDKSLLDEGSDSEKTHTVVQMNDDDESLKSAPECGCTNCDETGQAKPKPEIRDWRYWTIRFGITALAVSLGFLVSHYITAFFLGGLAVKAGFGAIGAKLATTKVGIAVHKMLALRSTGGQCCCCTCGGCNGCCPCGDACCSCAC